MTITTAQIRGARGILDWSQSDLANHTGISATSIGAIENGTTTPRASTIATIRKAFEDSGIEFLGADGIRKKNAYIDVLRGNEGFASFSYDIFKTMQMDNREVLQAYVDDKNFAHWLGDEAYPHIDRMETLTELKLKILQKEGDNYFPAAKYASYKWIPEQEFLAVPFIVYGDKLAIVLFEPEATVISINYPMVADAYRLQFNAIWDKAIEPPQSLLEKK